MSLCTYYRAGKCINRIRCQYKITSSDGKAVCKNEGEIGRVEKTSKGFKPMS